MAASAPPWPPSVPPPAVGAPLVGASSPGAAAPSLSEVARALGGPPGLAQAVAKDAASTAVRFWVLDNSGSMASPDGSRLVAVAGGSYRAVQSTRWEELREVADAHARLALALRSRIDFHLLNPPAQGGARQFISLGLESGALPSAGGAATMEDLRASLASSPCGSTPLTESVVAIHSLVEGMAPGLRAAGSQVVVVLATDGLPNDSDSFVRALVALQRLGCVWVVVRLCTDSEEVLEYWNGLDAQLEAPLEVLDDAAGEAGEVVACNPWLTYGLPLHTVRESGVRHKLFDLLDEQAFIGSQVAEMCTLLFGGPPLPNPEADWLGFQQRLGVLLATAAPTYCPRACAARPWVDLKLLRHRYGSGVRRPLFGHAEDNHLEAAPPELTTRPPPGADVVQVAFSARGLRWPSLFTRPAPFLAVSCAAGEGSYALLGYTAALQGTKEPAWAPLFLPRAAMHRWDATGQLRLDVLNFEADHVHHLLGSVTTTAQKLTDGAQMNVDIRCPTSGKISGKITAVVEPLA